jgi:hypothetical protein
MNSGWLLLIALGMVGVGGFSVAFFRGLAQTARKDTRQDLVKLGGVQEVATSLTKTARTPAYTFMGPFAEGRSHPFGWLWWRVEQNADGVLRHDMGWALTYRRARKAAGLPLSIRAQHIEFTLAFGHEQQNANDQCAGSGRP